MQFLPYVLARYGNMEKNVIFDCLEKLIFIYSYAEQQYMTLAAHSTAPVLRVFAGQRALKRMDFIEELDAAIVCGKGRTRPKTYDDLCERHVRLYGRNLLNTWISVEGPNVSADEKALEVCECLLKCPLPPALRELIQDQTASLESALLSLKYLKALYED